MIRSAQEMRRAWAAEGTEDDLAFVVDPERRPALYLIETDAAGERALPLLALGVGGAGLADGAAGGRRGGWRWRART